MTDRKILRQMRREEEMADILMGIAEGIARGAMAVAILLMVILFIAHSQPEEVQAAVIDEPQTVSEEASGEWVSLGTWKCSAYCPEDCCNGKGRAWKTASGIPMVIGETVATAKLPFGTKLLIDGHPYTVTDRGVPYGQVDILHESHSAANKFGIQYKQVFIWKE